MEQEGVQAVVLVGVEGWEGERGMALLLLLGPTMQAEVVEDFGEREEILPMLWRSLAAAAAAGSFKMERMERHRQEELEEVMGEETEDLVASGLLELLGEEVAVVAVVRPMAGQEELSEEAEEEEEHQRSAEREGLAVVVVAERFFQEEEVKEDLAAVVVVVQLSHSAHREDMEEEAEVVEMDRLHWAVEEGEQALVARFL